jgi:HD-like signal output (HDOD) protein/CheY-like chemotaxis protein
MPDRKRVLFVDDEQRVLDGLSRMLRGMRPEWDMLFATGGQEALEILARSPVDIVVSDMRMPNMDGPRFLTEVMRRFPGVVRLALSGQADREMTLRSVGPTHQYLSKPCNAETLKETIQRACATRDLLSESALIRLVSQAECVPSHPASYDQIMRELRAPITSIKRIGNIVSRDIGMAAKVLQLVNTAFFGLPQRVSNPAEAAAFLGLDTIRALAITLHIFSHFDQAALQMFGIDILWDHSLVTGALARRIAMAESEDCTIIDNTSVAGFLHDIGKLLLVAGFPEKYQQVIDMAAQDNRDPLEVEIETFGATHADISAYLLALWGLPDPVVEAVRFHHFPQKSADREFTPLTAAHVANALENERRAPSLTGSTSRVDLDYLATIGTADRLPLWRKLWTEITQNGGHHE